VPLFNRFRKHEAMPAKDARERDWHDHITLIVGILGFAVLVIATVITQINQVSSDRDTAEALQRFATIAESSKAEVSTLRDQARAAVLSAEAAKLQADAAQKQVEALEANVAISQQNASISKKMVNIAATNLESEIFFRARTLDAARPVFDVNIIVKNTEPTQTGDRIAAFSYGFSIRNAGQTAFTITYYSTTVEDADKLGVMLGTMGSVGTVVPTGGVVAIGETPVSLSDKEMRRFHAGQHPLLVKINFSVDDYLMKDQKVCRAFTVSWSDNEPFAHNSDCEFPDRFRIVKFGETEADE